MDTIIPSWTPCQGEQRPFRWNNIRRTIACSGGSWDTSVLQRKAFCSSQQRDVCFLWNGTKRLQLDFFTPCEIVPRPLSWERCFGFSEASGKRSQIMTHHTEGLVFHMQGFWPKVCLLAAFTGSADGLCFSFTSHFPYKWGRGLCHSRPR